MANLAGNGRFASGFRPMLIHVMAGFYLQKTLKIAAFHHFPCFRLATLDGLGASSEGRSASLSVLLWQFPWGISIWVIQWHFKFSPPIPEQGASARRHSCARSSSKRQTIRSFRWFDLAWMNFQTFPLCSIYIFYSEELSQRAKAGKGGKFQSVKTVF